MKGSLKIGPVFLGLLACALGAAGCRPRGRLTSGTELVLQVQLQDAYVAIADSAIQQIKEDLRKNNIQISDDAFTRTEPKTVEEAGRVQIDIKGIPATQASDFRRVVSGPAYSQWNVDLVNPPADWRMTLRPAAVVEIRRTTMDATMKTIDRKINGLGLAESWVQPNGGDPKDAELLVQFPPVDDPTHVIEVLRTRGILEWDQVIEGPFSNADEALAKHGGLQPLNSKLVPEAARGGSGPRYWLVSSIAVIRGSDIVSASASMGDERRWETDFVLSQKAADRFEAYTSANIGKQAAIVVDGQALSVPVIQGAIRDRGRIAGGTTTQQEAADLAVNLNAPLLAGLTVVEQRRIGSARTPNGKSK